MNIESFFNKFKTKNKIERNNKNDIFKTNEYNHNNYDIGVIATICDGNKYEVYLYVEAKNDVVSRILLQEFKNEFDTTNYFEELCSFAKEGNLEKIALRINSSNK